MAKGELEQRLDAALAHLTQGLNSSEAYAMSQTLRSAFQFHGELVKNASLLNPEKQATVKQRFLYQAMASLGECLVSIADALSAGHNESPGKLGGVISGLDRAACYVDGKPFEPRVYLSDVLRVLEPQPEPEEEKGANDGGA